MSVSFAVSKKAYAKMYLHAAKHPHKPVNGVLIGTFSQPTSTVIIEDAIPLLHHWTSLSPMMEIGLDLAKEHVREKPVQLVGYYQASDRIDDVVLAPVGERVAERLREGFPQAVAFVVRANTY